MPAVLCWGAGSQLLYSNSGNIAAAHFNSQRLIIHELNTVDIVGQGHIQPLMSNQQTVFSPQGEYQLVMNFIGNGDYYEVSKARLYNVNTGNLTASFDRPGFSGAMVSDEGYIAGIMRNINIADQSKLLFFNPQGRLLNTIDFPSVTNVRYFDNIVGAISGELGLKLFDSGGNEICALGKCQYYDYESTLLKNICAAADNNILKYYTSDGVYWEKELGTEVFRAVAVDAESGNAAVVSRSNLFIVNIYGEILYSRTSQNGENYTSCDIIQISGKVYIAAGWESDFGREVHYSERHTKGGYSIIRLNGKDFAGYYDESLNYDRWNIFTPAVMFHESQLIIQTMDEVRSISLSSVQW